MKIRTGFVSNSSSSSFIIKDKDIKTISEYAYLMMGIMEEEWDWYNAKIDEKERFNPKGFDEALDFLDKNQSFDEPIVIPWSCNFKTYIWKNSKGDICVDTCNNHDWGDLKYEYVNEDWKWEEFDYNMDGWVDAKYLNLETMEKNERNDWGAKYVREKKVFKNG